MLEKKAIKLLSLLSQDKFQTADLLAKKMNLHVKTVRQMAHRLSGFLEKNGAEIQIKRGTGYKLNVIDFEKFKQIFHSSLSQSPEMPNSSQERTQYLLEYFLNYGGYVKADELCDILYVSKRTLATDIKAMEKILNSYDILLERKPYYGMRISGKEFNIRQCMAKLRENSHEQASFLNTEALQETSELSQLISTFLGQENFQISDIALQNLIIHIYIAIKRIKNNQYVPLPEDDHAKYVSEDEYQRASRLAENLAKAYSVKFPKCEIIYMAIHFAGKRTMRISGSNIVISDNTISLVQSMLDEIYKAFQIDFRSDLELTISLGQHITPLQVRLRYGMKLKNPLLEDIKKRYCLAYVMASQASSVLMRHYHKVITPDEIGYIAINLELALERRRMKQYKKNILVVCASGAGTAKLLAFKMQSMFQDCIGKVTTCDEHSISQQDFSQIDYVFTTIPIKEDVPVPISEMKMFLGGTDIALIRRMLNSNTSYDILQYFPQNLFISNISFDNKQEAIRYICNMMQKQGKVDETFYDAVIQREQMGFTCMENLGAMPHPCKALTNDTFVSVCILDKPIHWNEGHLVQVIFLISPSKNQTKNTQDFYMSLANLMLNQEYMKELIDTKNYAVLEKLLIQSSKQ